MNGNLAESLQYSIGAVGGSEAPQLLGPQNAFALGIETATATIKQKALRTKKISVGVAALALGVASSGAQFYSANVFGYVKLNLTNGFNFVANQLDLDLTGTNNTLYTCFGTHTLPNTTKAWVFSGGGFSSASYVSSSGKWLGTVTNTINSALNPGGGIFIQIPGAIGSGSNVAIALVGNVRQGAITNTVTAGYQVLATPFPISGAIDSNFGYVPSKGDKIITWNPSSQNYNNTIPNYTGTKWLPSDPTIVVGQPIILDAASNNVWGLNFAVQ